jgi:hypothetical protein
MSVFALLVDTIPVRNPDNYGGVQQTAWQGPKKGPGIELLRGSESFDSHAALLF